MRPLKYTYYNKDLAADRSQQCSKWVEYSRKHGELLITHFYQDYLLPQRFSFDKRKAYFSSLILNGDITRDGGMHILQQDYLHVAGHRLADIVYRCSKLEISSEQFERYMSQPQLFHVRYRSLKTHSLYRFSKWMKSGGYLPKSLSHHLVQIVVH